MLKWIRDAFLISLITIVVVEIALRFASAVIPLRLLIRFSPSVRTEIAERRHLATELRTAEVRRDDGGPPLRVFPPRQFLRRAIDDRAAVESVTTDENGFCNAPVEDEAHRQVDFVAIGDSFTWCTGVDPEDGWVSRLAQITGIGGYNLGLGGVGPYEYLQILLTYGLSFRPRVVLFNFYEGNDLRDALGYQRYVDGHGTRVEREEKSADDFERAMKRALDTPILGKSYVFNLALASGMEGYAAIENARDPASSIDFRYRFDFPTGRIAFNLANTDSDEVAHARALRDGETSLAVLENALERFVALADQHGFEPIVLYTPSSYTSYADYVEFSDPALADLMPWFSRTQREFLQSQSETLGYRFIDLTPALRAAARRNGEQELLYFPANLHLTRSGHEVVARELASESVLR